MKKITLILLLFFSIIVAHAQHFSLIKDINPGNATSNVCYLTDVNNTLFFAANNGSNGMELWKTNGTEAGTVLVKDIQAGPASSSIGYLTNVNGTLFFVASNGVDGTELWKSDGTANGTVMVKDIRGGGMSSNPSSLVNLNGVLYFAADNGTDGTELWKSDGTEAGTVMVSDINSNGGSDPSSLVNVNGTLYFSADNGTDGIELWKSNGSANGTVMVKDIWADAEGSFPYNLTAIGNTLFFVANDGALGTELWKSDGTEAGTVLLKDIWSGANDAYPFDLKNVAGTLFFSADNGTTGIELWKSDGTTAGTMLVKDVWPGQESGAAGNFTKLINKLVFIGNDGVSGYKTWQSDGTQSGTKVATGIADPGNGTLQELVETGVKIYASIDESVTGTELWGVSYSTVLPLIWIDFTAKLVKNDALLNWTTSNEINTSEFIIERSVNGHDFEMVGRVAANDRAGVQQYLFTDAGITSLNKETVYYRVKQTDIDSRASYSSVVSIEMKQKLSLRLYPNPASQFISVDGSSLKGRVEFKVFDNSGKLVHKGAENVSGNLAIDISKLSAGGYYLDIRSDAINKQIQFVKN